MVLLQEAQLYAHFSPVALIHHPRVLSDFPSDDLGKTSIWERIKKAGEQTFYRVIFDDEEGTGEELSPEQKRTKEKEYVEGKGKDQLISTSIGDTPYIRNVIDVFVHGNKSEEKLDQLYTEPGEDYQ